MRDNFLREGSEADQSVFLGLPTIEHPDDNPPSLAKLELGRKLFLDRRLSANGTMACATCHLPEQAFVNREMQTAVGVEGRSGRRNSPTLLNSAYLTTLFHDGREISLETQFIAPLLARNEMANPSIGYVIENLRSFEDYDGLFETAFGGSASIEKMGQALAVFQRSLVAGNSPFDQWYFGGNDDAVSNSVKNGFELFSGAAGCSNCHSLHQTHAMFTDNRFHNIGYGWMREQDRHKGERTVNVQVAPGVHYEVSSSVIESVGEGRQADLGRYEVTQNPKHLWQFRTPSLRNVGATAPYMHDGGLSTLADVIDFYDKGGARHALLSPWVRPLHLTAEDKDNLEAFLNSLTSENLDCLEVYARSGLIDGNRPQVAPSLGTTREP
ncbi:cytochrome-c peroxidase [Ruegeria sp. ANG-S4]|uniref:cytochrome-c peroxidase n=1 Tax=Ruegeria sp. ANG-S4 TaxID=1577904 RepID=UPI00068C3516|nr:cytochrome c peroxidase [Ruegeria sp. ANG-S4]